MAQTLLSRGSHIPHGIVRMSSQIDDWFRLYRQELVSWIARFVRCHETAKDLVQETYLILARQATEETIAQPRGFLYRTAKNLALDYLRHQKVVEQYAVEADVRQEEAFYSAERAVTADKQIERFAATLENLPPLAREVFCLIKLDGLSYRETALRLNLSERQVERQLLKAMLDCRKVLEED
ncbi:RNA polymerase, sigma-24 subunit, ECF subfamily [Methylocaldum marinum]|uniref:RNA polymerase, sigma-24 subunit, ECF subfamily n=2 Tax=Methylocaldum marinum TaxID=1432792 RepID=A0A250KYC2_9GAMM|nr:RNA polymerase, sigma-24 subunit, ECF subfamily [Methylocaldum marinum]